MALLDCCSMMYSGDCFQASLQIHSGSQFLCSLHCHACNLVRNEQGFAKLQIAPMLNGRIDIQYRRVECTPPVPVKVQIDGNSGTGGWLRLAVTVCSSCFAPVPGHKIPAASAHTLYPLLHMHAYASWLPTRFYLVPCTPWYWDLCC